MHSIVQMQLHAAQRHANGYSILSFSLYRLAETIDTSAQLHACERASETIRSSCSMLSCCVVSGRRVYDSDLRPYLLPIRSNGRSSSSSAGAKPAREWRRRRGDSPRGRKHRRGERGELLGSTETAGTSWGWVGGRHCCRLRVAVVEVHHRRKAWQRGAAPMRLEEQLSSVEQRVNLALDSLHEWHSARRLSTYLVIQIRPLLWTVSTAP